MILRTENNNIENALAVVFALNGFITAIDGYRVNSLCRYTKLYFRAKYNNRLKDLKIKFYKRTS